jgi:hypothetical protein
MGDNDGVSVANDSCGFDMLLTHGVSIEYLYKKLAITKFRERAIDID